MSTILFPLLQSFPSEGWQDEAGLVDIRVVISEKSLFLLSGKASDRDLDVAVGVLGADHEADLARWVGWDSGVGVLDSWENLPTVLLQFGDQREMEPLVLSY